MPTGNYIGRSFGEAIGLGVEAGQAGIQRGYGQRLHEQKERQRGELFGSLSQLLGIGSTIYESYKANTELIDYASGKGFEVSSGKLSKFFGQPSFEKGGERFTSDFMYGLRGYEEYGKQKNLLDFITNGGF